jgi:hypothetical protein
MRINKTVDGFALTIYLTLKKHIQMIAGFFRIIYDATRAMRVQ